MLPSTPEAGFLVPAAESGRFYTYLSRRVWQLLMVAGGTVFQLALLFVTKIRKPATFID